MTTFKMAIKNPQPTLTANGAAALDKTGNQVLDLFYQGPAARGNLQQIQRLFIQAYQQNPELALRCALYIRDVREGAGERDTFRTILQLLEELQERDAARLMTKIPELGRWDDILSVKSKGLRSFAAQMVSKALMAGDGLCAKWMPRKGLNAVFLRTAFGMSPKAYRKLLVENTKVVETQMCSNKWNGINFNHVPSRAFSIYKRAFQRHEPARFQAFIDSVLKKEKSIKVNAAAIYPHDVIKTMMRTHRLDKAELAQWENLPNWTGENTVLPMVDVSGSMGCVAGGGTCGNVTCMDVAVSLGLYLADKQKNEFKNIVLTFSGDSRLELLKGNVFEKIIQLQRMHWGMSTDVVRAARNIVKFAKENAIPDANMPRILLILSDMQFNPGLINGGSSRAQNEFEQIFEQNGYTAPNIVYWNLNARYNNAPVEAGKNKTALISGFSPSILEAVCKGDLSEMSPESIMLKKLMKPRYNVD